MKKTVKHTALGIVLVSTVIFSMLYYQHNLLPYKQLSGTWKLIEEHKYGPNVACDIRYLYQEDGTMSSINNKRVSTSTYTLTPLEVGYRFRVTSVDDNGRIGCNGKVLNSINNGFTRVGYLELNKNNTAFKYCGDSISEQGYKRSRVCTVYKRIKRVEELNELGVN